MDAGEKRFRWILASVFGVFILADFAIPGISNVILQSRTRRVQEGMTEQQAVEIMKMTPLERSGGKKEIVWGRRGGWLEMLYWSISNPSLEKVTVISIDNGVVRSIEKTIWWPYMLPLPH